MTLKTLLYLCITTFNITYKCKSPNLFLTPEFSQSEGDFALLENYPDLDTAKLSSNDPSIALGTYIDWIVKFSLGLLSIGAVIALVVAGIQYIGSETWSKKSDSKDMIMRSIGALVLMFSAFIFFEQLNPELLKVRFEPIDLTPESVTIKSVDDIWKGVLSDIKPENAKQKISDLIGRGYQEESDNCENTFTFSGAGALSGASYGSSACLGGPTPVCAVGVAGGAVWGLIGEDGQAALLACTENKKKYQRENPSRFATPCLYTDQGLNKFCFYSIDKKNKQAVEGAGKNWEAEFEKAKKLDDEAEESNFRTLYGQNAGGIFGGDKKTIEDKKKYCDDHRIKKERNKNICKKVCDSNKKCETETDKTIIKCVIEKSTHVPLSDCVLSKDGKNYGYFFKNVKGGDEDVDENLGS